MRSLFKIYFLIAVCIPLSSFGQGVDFKKIPLGEASQVAIRQKRLVFLDFYTEWCGPCKRMNREVFSQKEVGDYFNRNFVCLKIDAEKEKALAAKYKIQGYPTFIVLKADGTEVYRTSGFCPAEMLLEKIRYGIDPKWTPENMAKRYAKGERTPHLVNVYAFSLMEQGKEKEGYDVVNGYFNQLSDKKKARLENFFLYTRYALKLGDVKARYLLNHKDAFVKNIGLHVIDSLLYNWLRSDLMPFVVLRSAQTQINRLLEVKADIAKAGLLNAGCMTDLIEIAELRQGNDMRKYVEVCRERFPRLEERDRFSILLSLDMLANESIEVRMLAVDLMRDNMVGLEGINQRVFRAKMLELEGKKAYTLRAQIDAAESGKVVVMGWSPAGNIRDTFNFTDHRINLELAGKDTMRITLKLLCEELACLTLKMGMYYPNVELMLVPGEIAVVDIRAERGKVPQIEWLRGGSVGHDYYRLQYEKTGQAEIAYRQLTMDNIIRGGDIRDYKDEFTAYVEENKVLIMSFIRENPNSYIAAINLLERYIWFDENETEQLYERFPESLKSTVCGKIIKRKLDAGRPYRAGTEAPDFTKKDMDGKTVTLSELRGKYILLDFWGSWCGPCRESHPHLKELHRKYGKKVEFIHVANENARDLVQARRLWEEAVREDGLTWTQILNNEGVKDCNLLRLFNISSFPTKILIDPEGKIVARYVGASGDPTDQLKQIFE